MPSGLLGRPTSDDPLERSPRGLLEDVRPPADDPAFGPLSELGRTPLGPLSEDDRPPADAPALGPSRKPLRMAAGQSIQGSLE